MIVKFRKDPTPIEIMEKIEGLEVLMNAYLQALERTIERVDKLTSTVLPLVESMRDKRRRPDLPEKLASDLFTIVQQYWEAHHLPAPLKIFNASFMSRAKNYGGTPRTALLKHPDIVSIITRSGQSYFMPLKEYQTTRKSVISDWKKGNFPKFNQYASPVKMTEAGETKRVEEIPLSKIMADRIVALDEHPQEAEGSRSVESPEAGRDQTTD
jgi:hypothetical protein